MVAVAVMCVFTVLFTLWWGLEDHIVLRATSWLWDLLGCLEVKTLRADNAALASELEAVREKNSQLERAYDTALRAFAQEIKSLKKNASETQGQQACNLEKLKEQYEEQLNSLEAVVVDLTEAREADKLERQGWLELISVTTQQRAEAQQEAQVAKEELFQREEELLQLDEINSELSQALTSANQGLANLRQQADMLQSALSSAEKEREIAEVECRIISMELSAVQGQLQDILQTQTTQLDTNAAEVLALKQALDDLQREKDVMACIAEEERIKMARNVDLLKASLNLERKGRLDVEDVLEKCLSKIKVLTGAVETERQKRQDTDKGLQEREREVSALKKDVADLKSTMKAKDCCIASLEEELRMHQEQTLKATITLKPHPCSPPLSPSSSTKSPWAFGKLH